MVAHWGDCVGHLHWGWDLWWRKGGWRLATPPNSPQHLIWEDAVQALPQPPDVVFAVVRDPKARMQSEYRWQRLRRRGTRIGRALAYLPFGLWLRVMLALACRYPHAFDNHFRPQTAFIPKDAQVFKLEDGLEAALSWLAVQTGVSYDPVTSARHNATGLGVVVAPKDAARIAQTFAEDYARFGYTPQTTDPVRRDLADLLAAILAPGLAWLDRRGRL